MRRRSGCGPPPIIGDPFTDSQEHPDRFAVGPVRVDGSRAMVSFVFNDGHRPRPVEYVLRRVHAAWLIHDLRFDDGAIFHEALPAVPHQPGT